MALGGHFMSETIPDKPGQGFREFFGAVGFTLVLIGGELIFEKDGQRFWTGIYLVAAAIPVYLSGAFWRKVKDKRIPARMDAIADRAPWWIRGAFIGLLAFIISQAIGTIHWLAGSQQIYSFWPALTSAEASAFTSRIRFVPPEEIVVACETINCKDLADGIADILQKTQGWHVSILHSGGLGITGVTGILINPNEPATQSLKDAIESTTNLKVTMGHDSRNDIGNNQSFLVIGTRPF
jgi:hypothetical protein